MSVSVVAMVDVRNVLKGFDLQEKQVRFAAARALTDMAKLSQEAVRQRMGEVFTMRRNWIRAGVRIKPATRADLTAAVLSLDEYMGRQEHGGEKVPRSGRHIAVPGPVLRPEGASKSKRRIPPSEFPRAALTQARTFKARTRKGAQVIMRRLKGTEKGTPRRMLGRLFRQRFGRKAEALRKRAKGRRLKRAARIVHTLIGRAYVKSRLGMGKRTLQIVNELFARRFLEHWEEAKRTAKA